MKKSEKAKTTKCDKIFQHVSSQNNSIQNIFFKLLNQ
jgi:hypothetical protein